MAEKMKHKIPEFHFENDDHVFSYLHYLMAENLDYHFDDSPMDIVWNTRDLDTIDKMNLQANHERLSAYCNPWEWFDKHPQMWSYWTRGSEVYSPSFPYQP